MAATHHNDFSLADPGLGQDALGSWQQVASEVFVPLRLEQTSDRFHWAVDAYSFGALAVSDIRLAQHKVERSAADIGAGNSDYFLLSLQVDGLARFHSQNGVSWIGPGDCVLYDASMPYGFEFETSMRQHVLRLPRDLIEACLPNARRLAGRRLSSVTGLNSVFAHSFSSAMRTANTLAYEERDQLAQALLIILGQMLVNEGADRAEPLTQRSKTQMSHVEAYIEANLANERLSVATLCDAFSLTPKALHRLFQRHGDETPMRLVQRKRLERAAADLQDPGLKDVSITQLAMRYGFCDGAHFSHRFKRRFGISPIALRARNQRALL
ncbi:MAG: helix-turn-helix domain-containing protein [Pseudomonadota bacterium]